MTTSGDAPDPTAAPPPPMQKFIAAEMNSDVADSDGAPKPTNPAPNRKQSVTATGNTEGPELEGDPVNQAAKRLWSQYDPSRMKLTKKEHQWAVAIKSAIEKIPDLDNLSDFMYAQIALVAEGNVDDAVVRAYRLQEFKESNYILDTTEDGFRNLPKGAVLSVDYNLQTGGYIYSVDVAVFQGQDFQSHDSLCAYNRMSFYSCHIVHPDFESIRAGVVTLAECEGYRWLRKEVMDLGVFKSVWESAFAYPRNFHYIKFFNTSPLFRVMVSMAKAALPREISSKFQIGGKSPLGRLDKLYNLPNPEVANARLQEKLKDLIVRRYANERYFSLDQEPLL